MKRIFKLAVLSLLALIGAYLIWLGVPREDYFAERIGEIEVRERSDAANASAVDTTVRIESSTGLRVDLRVLRPRVSEARKLPVLVLVGGHRTGKDAVDLAGAHEKVAFVAIDYPYTGSHKPEGTWEAIKTVPHIQDAFLDSPPALALVAAWLSEEEWVDPNRIELVGASLGVPFGAVAGAIEKRFSRVWLLHGGGDNVPWVAHVGRKHIDNDTLRRFAARFALLLVYGNSFDTPKWIARTAPRPAVAGERVFALAVTEPDAGSDVAAIRTRARRAGDA
ncbi:MAG: hypothetical protein ACE5F8_03245 [Woeseiaceae bacterium]